MRTVVPRLLLSLFVTAALLAACGMAYKRGGVPPALYAESDVERGLPPEANTESYERRYDNPFLTARDNPISTFSIDVDTASYANVRRFLREGALPPPDAVRIEEMVNYFRYDDPEPAGEHPIAITTEVGPCPWQAEHRLVRVGLRARSLPAQALPLRNLTFLIDVSGSMGHPLKLPLLKRAFALLVETLRSEDRVAIVVYAGAEGLALPPTPGSQKEVILQALERLESGGSTNGGAGIELAYQIARRAFVAGGINRVILATDGDFNVGVSSPGDLVRMVESQRQSGVFLTVLGFGMGNLKDSMLESLADKGNGNYAYVDSFPEARKVLVEDAAGTLVTIAKDVKVQVELNPAEVASYRLIGYENRLLRREEFDDDAADAGDMGAGQTVTALYEVVPARGRPGASAGAAPLRYQQPAALSATAGTGELLAVKIRYKRPDGATSQLLSCEVRDDGRPLDGTSPSFRFAAAVAGFGLVLRESPHKGAATFALARSLAASAFGPARTGRDAHKQELLTLVDTAAHLGEKRGFLRP